ncbi:Juvenile hormone epoxide hydrolase 1 [Anthophora quadrimaculata]
MWKTAAVLGLLASGITFFLSTSDETVPTFPETNWGLKKSTEESSKIRPFKIDVPESVIEDLKYRLAHRKTYVEPLEDAAWTYGISTKYLNTVLDYWKDKYNWSARQALLNKYPQFKTNVQGLDIHFYHIKPKTLQNDKNIKVLPLMIVHGWPGSVVEFQKIIPILTEPQPNRDFVFEVIAPSLPGYGFSEGAVRQGLATAQIAVIFKNLMQRLGFEKFYIQGGDWGSIVVTNMASLFPEKIIGVHSNMCSAMAPRNFIWSIIGSYVPWAVGVSEHYSKFYPFKKVMSKLIEESGYFHIQATKPDTIGVALTSAPDGLAAYILEKFSTWTNVTYKERNDGGLTEKFTLDELLDNVMVYWITNSITTSMRLYAENFNPTYMALKVERLPVKVPTGCAVFPDELLIQPKSLLENKFPQMIHYNFLPRGGHFAAFEEPKLMAEDIFSFVEKVEKL